MLELKVCLKEKVQTKNNVNILQNNAILSYSIELTTCILDY